MTRYGRRKTGGTRTGLFAWTPNGDVPDEVDDNPLTRRCPWCHASPGEPCRRLTRRRGWITTEPHDARKTPATDEPQHPAPAPQTAAQPPEGRS